MKCVLYNFRIPFDFKVCATQACNCARNALELYIPVSCGRRTLKARTASNIARKMLKFNRHNVPSVFFCVSLSVGFDVGQEEGQCNVNKYLIVCNQCKRLYCICVYGYSLDLS